MHSTLNLASFVTASPPVCCGSVLLGSRSQQRSAAAYGGVIDGLDEMRKGFRKQYGSKKDLASRSFFLVFLIFILPPCC